MATENAPEAQVTEQDGTAQEGAQESPEQTETEIPSESSKDFMSYASEKSEETSEEVPEQETKDAYIEDMEKRHAEGKEEPEEQKEKDAWYIKDGVKGDGEMPEHFNSKKYKSVDAQLKAQQELEKRFGAFEGAPDEYDFSFTDSGFVAPDLEAETTQRFIKTAKEMNLSQKGMEELWDIFTEAVDDILPPTMDEVRHELGDQADDLLRKNATWLGKHLAKEDQEVISAHMTAPLLQVLDKIRRINGDRSVAPPKLSNGYTGAPGDMESFMRDNKEAFLRGDSRAVAEANKIAEAIAARQSRQR